VVAARTPNAKRPGEVRNVAAGRVSRGTGKFAEASV